MDCQLTLRQYLPTLSISFLTLTTSAHPLNNLIHYAKITHLVPKSAHTLPTSAHTSKCLLTLPNICNTINTPPPYYAKIYPTFHLPTVCQLRTTSDHTKPTSVHPFNTYPHYANICPNHANICWHYAKICGHLPTLCQPLGPLCTHYANICTLFQHMLTLCQLVVSDCPLSLMYFNIVVILTWKVPSLHKVCLRRNVKSGVFTLMPIS